MTPYPYPPVRQPLPAHPRATLSLVLGIVGVAGFFVLLLPVLASPLAWYFGAVAQREAEREPTRWSEGSSRAGMVLGMVGTALLALLLLLLFLAAFFSVIGWRYDSGYPRQS